MSGTTRDPVRCNGKTVGEVRVVNGSKTFVWFQNLLRMYGEDGGFSMSESVLGQLPLDCETFIAVTDDKDAYVFQREQFETGEKIPVTDERFNEAPPEDQYAVSKEEAISAFNDLDV